MEYIYKYLPYLIAAMSFLSVQQWMNITITNTALNWTVSFLILAAFAVVAFRAYRYSDYRYPATYIAYYLLVIMSACYGIEMSEGYWDYKSLVSNFLSLSLPLSYIYFAQPTKVARTLGVWIVFAFVTLWLMLPFMQLEAVGRYLVPASFMLLFFRYQNGRTQIVLLIFFACLFIFGSLGARSNIVRFAVPFLLGMMLYVKDYLSIFLLKSIAVIALFIPLVFFALGISGTFNIFDFKEYLSMNEVEVDNPGADEKPEDLTDDTRTFIYVEEILSAVKNNYVIHGRSLARGYDTDYFTLVDIDTVDRGERPSSEVGILNVFNYMGILGAMAYMAIFIGCIVSVFRGSKNKAMYFVLLYVMFRWIWGWIEDCSRFDMNMMILWMAMAMCYSGRFLKMNDRQFAAWAGSISKIK